MDIRVELEPGAKMPSKAHPADAAFDLYCIEGGIVHPKESVTFDTGVHMAIPEGYCGILISKSGLNVRYSMTSTGLIDAGYTGTIAVKLYNHGLRDYRVLPHEKISQITIVKLPAIRLHRVDRIEDETERGQNGFGSSGRR